jgi:hypothetical protein
MTRIILTLVFSFLFLACKTTAPAEGTTTTTDRKLQSELKGNWKITAVNFPGSGYFKINSFQVADSKCFVGSSWQFVPNNNKGNMSLNSGDCPSFSSPIVWSISKDSVFSLKFINPGTKSKDVTQGFVLRIANQTPSSFQLIDRAEIGGQIKEIVYQFEKTN